MSWTAGYWRLRDVAVCCVGLAVQFWIAMRHTHADVTGLSSCWREVVVVGGIEQRGKCSGGRSSLRQAWRMSKVALWNNCTPGVLSKIEPQVMVQTMSRSRKVEKQKREPLALLERQRLQRRVKPLEFSRTRATCSIAPGRAPKRKTGGSRRHSL